MVENLPALPPCCESLSFLSPPAHYLTLPRAFSRRTRTRTNPSRHRHRQGSETGESWFRLLPPASSGRHPVLVLGRRCPARRRTVAAPNSLEQAPEISSPPWYCARQKLPPAPALVLLFLLGKKTPHPSPVLFHSQKYAEHSLPGLVHDTRVFNEALQKYANKFPFPPEGTYMITTFYKVFVFFYYC